MQGPPDGAPEDTLKQMPSVTDSGAPNVADLWGAFTLDELEEEFKAERHGICESRPHVQTRREQRLAEIQKKLLDVQHMESIARPQYVENLPQHAMVASIVDSKWFQYLFFAMIVFYSVMMGCELSYDEYSDMWFRVNCFFTFIFMVEGAMKIYVYGHTYFLVTWFLLEFTTVCGSFVSLGMHYSGVSDTYRKTFLCLKVSRIALLGKLFSIREEFQVIVLGFSRSLVSLWSVFFVLCVVCYGCTLFIYSVVGKHEGYDPVERSTYFGNIPKIMMTLFSMIIVDEWAGYARPVYLEQPPVVIFFFIFSIMTTLGLLNVVTGMVVEHVNCVSADHQAVKRLEAQEIQRQKLTQVVDVVFHAGDGHAITEEEFESHDSTDELIDMITTVDFPSSFTLKDLFTVLDWPGQKQILLEHFVDGVMNFIHGEQFQLDCQLMLSINKVRRDVIAMRKEMRSMHHRMQYDMHRPALKTAKSEGPGRELSEDKGGMSMSSDNSDTAPDESSRYDSDHGDPARLEPLKEDYPIPGEDVQAAFAAIRPFSVAHLANEFEMEKLKDRQSTCLTTRQPEETPTKKSERFAADNSRTSRRRVIPVDMLPYHKTVVKLVESWYFQGLYFSLVAIFAIVMGFELEFDDEKYETRWFYLNTWFTFMFCVEAFCKVYAYGDDYFRVPWFILEFSTSVGACMTVGMYFYGLSDDFKKTFMCIKLTRIILLGKLFELREEFQTVVVGFTRSLIALWGIIFVLLVINYGCTLFCYSLIGKHDYSATNPDHDLYWGSIPKTMITLFSMMIADNWTGYSRPVYTEQPHLMLFFVLYIVILTMGLLNVVTGIVVDTVTTVRIEREKRKDDKRIESQRQRLNEVIDEVFPGAHDPNYEITESEFISHASKGELMELLEIVDVPHHFSLKDFFTVLDCSGHKSMFRGQFIDGLVTLINSTNFHRECQILLGVHKIRRGLVDLRQELSTMHHRLKHLTVSNAKAQEAAAAAAAQGPTLPWDQAPARRLRDPPSSDQKFSQNADQWEQVRSTLHGAAMEHCFEELRKAWDALETERRRADPRSKRRAMPSMTPTGSLVDELQEEWYVWHKLYSAVSSESLQELRQALDHARIIGLSDKSSAILFTFCDALARQQQQVEVIPSEEIAEALDSGDWVRALDLVIETSLAQGAEKTLLLNALARLCTDSSGTPAWEPERRFRANSALADIGHGKRQGFGNAATVATNGVKLEFDQALSVKQRGKTVEATLTAPGMPEPEMRGRLVSVLYTEAADHALKELNKAWEELDRAYRAAEKAGSARRGYGPGFSPFSTHEEQFFIRKQISNAVTQESLLELRRALAHAMTCGVDPVSIEIEAAYRDALTRHQQGVGFSSQYVIATLERGDWWTALDDIIGASFARGADRHTLLKMIAKVCSPTTHLLPSPRSGSVASSYAGHDPIGNAADLGGLVRTHGPIGNVADLAARVGPIGAGVALSATDSASHCDSI